MKEGRKEERKKERTVEMGACKHKATPDQYMWVDRMPTVFVRLFWNVVWATHPHVMVNATLSVLPVFQRLLVH